MIRFSTLEMFKLMIRLLFLVSRWAHHRLHQNWNQLSYFSLTMKTSRKFGIYFRDWFFFGLSHAIIINFYAVLCMILEAALPNYVNSKSLALKLFIIHICWMIYYHIHRSTYYPPGPPPMAIFGNAPFINIKEPYKTILEYRELYGPVFTFFLPHPNVILADFKSIQEGMITQGSHTSGRSSNESFVLFTNDRENGDGVILAMRQKWKDMRAEITRYFGSLYGSQIDELILHHTRTLEVELKQEADKNEPVDICDFLTSAIANVIQQITIGKTFKYDDEEFRTQMRDINTVVKEIMTAEVFLVNSYPWLSRLPDGILKKWTNYKKSGFRLQNWFRSLLQDHIKNRHQGDFMSHMLDRQESGKDGFKDLSIILTCGDIWTGGMETTVTTLRWGIIYLLLHPEAQTKCHEEILEVFGSSEPEMRYMLKTPYIRATISEIQRVANVLPWAIPHLALEKCTIDGHQIPVGTEIIPAIGAVLTDPKVFENPYEFKPERFLDQDGSYKPIEQFRPFGLGPRICLGERIARVELYIIFCSLLQNFRFYIEDGDEIPTLERMIGGITAPPKRYKSRIEYLGVREVK